MLGTAKIGLKERRDAFGQEQGFTRRRAWTEPESHHTNTIRYPLGHPTSPEPVTLILKGTLHHTD